MAKFIIKQQVHKAKVLYNVEEVKIHPVHITMDMLAYHIVTDRKRFRVDDEEWGNLTTIFCEFSRSVLNIPLGYYWGEQDLIEKRNKEIEKARAAGLYDGYSIVRMNYEIQGNVYKTTHICKDAGLGEEVYKNCLEEITESDVVIIDETAMYLDYDQDIKEDK